MADEQDHEMTYESRHEYRSGCSCGWMGEWTRTVEAAGAAYDRHVEEEKR